MVDLVAGTGGAGRNIVLDIPLHSRPPEALFSHKQALPGARMTGNVTGVGPVNDLRAEIRRHKKLLGGQPLGGVMLALALGPFPQFPR